MRVDAIVMGLGAMGAAAARALARRKLSVVGIDQADIPNQLGSSHGRSRIIRRAYFEDASYVPLLHRAYELWDELAAECAEPLLYRTGCLTMGPARNPAVAGAESAAIEHGLAYERLDVDSMVRRFPGVAPGADYIGVYEAEAGFLVAERCVAVLAEGAVRAGATLFGRQRVSRVELDDVVRVVTDAGRFEAGALAVCTGAWLAGAGAPLGLSIPLEVERQVQIWLAPRKPALFRPGTMPVVIRADDDGKFYSLPMHDHPGVKVGRHHGGARTAADRLDRTLRASDEQVVRRFVRAYLPEADGPLVAAHVCMYTNTPDRHFVVGPHPAYDSVVVAGGFSGHGFKFAPVIGEIIADLVTTGETSHNIELFDPSRKCKPARD
jgi:sarcosine oxidase